MSMNASTGRGNPVSCLLVDLLNSPAYMERQTLLSERKIQREQERKTRRQEREKREKERKERYTKTQTPQTPQTAGKAACGDGGAAGAGAAGTVRAADADAGDADAGDADAGGGQPGMDAKEREREEATVKAKVKDVGWEALSCSVTHMGIFDSLQDLGMCL